MSLYATNFQPNPYSRTGTTQPNKRAQFITSGVEAQQPEKSRKKSGSFMKKALLGAVLVGGGGVLFAKARPEAYQKGVALLAQYMPDSVKQATDTVLNHGSQLWENAGTKLGELSKNADLHARATESYAAVQQFAGKTLQGLKTLFASKPVV